MGTEYCKAINSSAVPTIQSTWTYVVQSQLRKCTKDAVQAYRSYMNDKVMQRLPMNEDQVRFHHKAAKAEALRIFSAPNFAETNAGYQEYRAELSKRIKQLYDHVQAENASVSQQQCESYAEELWRTTIESKLKVKGSYKNVEQLMQDWELLQRTFIERTQGPAQVDVLSGMLFQKMTESVHRVEESRRNAPDERPRYCSISSLMTVLQGGSTQSE